MKSVKDALVRICRGCIGVSAALICGTSIIASIGMGRDLSVVTYVSATLSTVLVAINSVQIARSGITYINNKLNEMHGLINLLIQAPHSTEEKEDRGSCND